MHIFARGQARLAAPVQDSAAAEPARDQVAMGLSRHWRMALALLLALVVGLFLLGVNQFAGQWGDLPTQGVADAQVISLKQVWAAEGDAPSFNAAHAKSVVLPDEWARSQGAQATAVWYRASFALAHAPSATGLLGLDIERACAASEVWLNGQLVWRSNGAAEPYCMGCFADTVVPLASALLRAQGNVIELRVSGHALQRVTARQRAGGLAGLRVGPLGDIRQMADQHAFWTTTLSQVLAGVLAFMGVFALGLAWVRRLSYLLYFGLLTMGWAVMTGRIWVSELPLPSDTMEVLICILMAPMTAFAVKFLLHYAGVGPMHVMSARASSRLDLLLWAQCLLLPLSLPALGTSHLFLGAQIWFAVFALELLAAMGHFLWQASLSRRPEFWLMGGAMGVVAAVMLIELGYQYGLLMRGGMYVAHFVMPMLYAVVGVRLIQVYAKALQSAEGARTHLERRVQEISQDIERNFTQLAELRVEQIAEKERKRIAGDLHDDLGAKLLTIVHTSDNDRISTLAREALEEMRLSVRGLTGRPMVLSDSLADWRSEVVSRLGQAGIECEWRNPNDTIEEPLSSRTFVQTTRIVREAVSNIIKHSGASHVVITADVDLPQHVFSLVIADNGRGIPTELDGRLDRGHGMTSMKHRAKQLSGQCLVESGPGFGTVIRLTLPLEIAAMQQVLPTLVAAEAHSSGLGPRSRGQ